MFFMNSKKTFKYGEGDKIYKCFELFLNFLKMKDR